MMPYRSFCSPITNSTSISAMPTADARSNAPRGIGRPRSLSMPIISTWPPSSGRNGSRLKIASESEISAISRQVVGGADVGARRRCSGRCRPCSRPGLGRSTAHVGQAPNVPVTSSLHMHRRRVLGASTSGTRRRVVAARQAGSRYTPAAVRAGRGARGGSCHPLPVAADDERDRRAVRSRDRRPDVRERAHGSVPSMATIRSPARSPAATAGDPLHRPPRRPGTGSGRLRLAGDGKNDQDQERGDQVHERPGQDHDQPAHGCCTASRPRGRAACSNRSNSSLRRRLLGGRQVRLGGRDQPLSRRTCTAAASIRPWARSRAGLVVGDRRSPRRRLRSGSRCGRAGRRPPTGRPRRGAVHARDLDVAAERDGADARTRCRRPGVRAISGGNPIEKRSARMPARLGGQEVAQLVDEDQDQQPERCATK